MEVVHTDGLTWVRALKAISGSASTRNHECRLYTHTHMLFYFLKL